MTIAADAPVSAPAPPPIVPVMVVESVAWLLGWNEVVTVPAEPVTPEVGVRTAVKPANGVPVDLKVTGTPAWPEPSFTVIVIAAEPAV